MWCAGCAETSVADRIVSHLQSGEGGDRVRYPGERTLAVREQHLREGIPVDPAVWQFVKSV